MRHFTSPNSYLHGKVYINDKDLTDFANEHGKTIQEVIEDMANEGWTQGMDKWGNHEYWE